MKAAPKRPIQAKQKTVESAAAHRILQATSYAEEKKQWGTRFPASHASQILFESHFKLIAASLNFSRNARHATIGRYVYRQTGSSQSCERAPVYWAQQPRRQSKILAERRQ